MLNTFAKGSPAGIAKMSVSGCSAGFSTTTLFVCDPGSSPAVASAAGSAGMNPPLAVIAAMFEIEPRATMGMPGIRRFRTTATNTATVDTT
jgi:hypothetical protein